MYSMKVHRSLLGRDLLAGVPQMGLMLLFVLSVLFLYLFRMYFMAAPIAALYVVMRHLTSKDPWFIEVVMDNIQQKDIYIP
jgi:type IV secretory pathway VirB3-like protein